MNKWFEAVRGLTEEFQVGLTPEEIERREFASTLRGYDRDEVRSFLSKVSRTVRDLQIEVADAHGRAENEQGVMAASAASLDVEPDRFGAIGDRVAELLRLGHDSASQLRVNAEAEAEGLLNRSRAEAEQMTSEAEARLLSARSHSEALLGDARNEAENLLADARAEAETLMTTAEAETEYMRSSSRADAENLRNSAGDQAEQLLLEAEAESEELKRQASEVLLNSQNRADELWAVAEAEAFKLREDGRIEADQIREAALLEAAEVRDRVKREMHDFRAEAEAEAERMSSEAATEVHLLRETTSLESERQRSEAAAEAERMTSEARQILADHQAEAEELRNRAVADAERSAADAQAEAERIRAEAEAEAARMRDDAGVYVDTRREEAEGYFSEKQRESHDYVAVRRQEADDYVAARQGEVYTNAAEAEAERDRALTGIADAREQVKVLLEQARAQSEFIRQEAEEVIRSKVRANIDQAERRISRLRITEQASRERIIAAQSELQSAIGRLDSEPVHELGDGTDDLVLAEAEQRVLSAGPTGGPAVASWASGEMAPATLSAPQAAEEEIIDLVAEVPYAMDSLSFNDPMDETMETFETNEATNGVFEVEQVLAEPEIEPQDEDALSRLVREAMQRAVESAKGGE